VKAIALVAVFIVLELWMILTITSKIAAYLRKQRPQLSTSRITGRITAHKSKSFRYSMAAIERAIEEAVYEGSLTPVPVSNTQLKVQFWNLPKNSLAQEQINELLSPQVLGPPHGLDLLVIEEPKLPDLPERPDQPADDLNSYLTERYDRLAERLEATRTKFRRQVEEDRQQFCDITKAVVRGDPEGIKRLLKVSLARHPLPTILIRDSEIDLDLASRIVLCTIEVPDLTQLPILRKRSRSGNWLPVSATDRRKATEAILHSLCIRAAYLIAVSGSPHEHFDTVAVNARQKWFDGATGAPREGIIASLQATASELRELQPGQLEPKACFRHLKGISTPSIEQVSPIRPIFAMSTTDQRIIENRDVDAKLESEANLAAMPWDDFEHLVRQLFEWEFGRNGIEVKVTRASRDRGVDAIMFDPDPLRGGKYVLQAKRYTRPVDVAAVRDLFGTVMNEGANRGILVTTSSYGPDSYAFAKDKPLSLVDGPNLLAMLQKHGRKFRIDVAEARRLEAAVHRNGRGTQ
jgi:restriction system protein